jgi:hypothetical protein
MLKFDASLLFWCSAGHPANPGSRSEITAPPRFISRLPRAMNTTTLLRFVLYCPELQCKYHARNCAFIHSYSARPCEQSLQMTNRSRFLTYHLPPTPPAFNPEQMTHHCRILADNLYGPTIKLPIFITCLPRRLVSAILVGQLQPAVSCTCGCTARWRSDSKLFAFCSLFALPETSQALCMVRRCRTAWPNASQEG